MNLTPERRAELLSKLEALLNMTIENGCTEAEAEAAARMADSLREKYGLSLEELEGAQPDEAVIIDTVWTGSTRDHPVARCLIAIARFTRTEIYTQSRERYRTKEEMREWVRARAQARASGERVPGWKKKPERGYGFAGTPADVEVAKFLVELLKTSMEVCWARYWKETKAEANRMFELCSAGLARSAFMQGITHRLNERLNEMVKARDQKANSNSREIIRLTDSLIKAKLTQSGITLRTRRDRSRDVDDLTEEHWGAGYDAGDGITIAAGFVPPAKQKERLE